MDVSEFLKASLFPAELNPTQGKPPRIMSSSPNALLKHLGTTSLTSWNTGADGSSPLLMLLMMTRWDSAHLSQYSTGVAMPCSPKVIPAMPVNRSMERSVILVRYGIAYIFVSAIKRAHHKGTPTDEGV